MLSSGIVLQMYIPRFPPYAKQKEALERLKGQDAFALLMQMRTGKTKVILDEFGQNEDDGICSDLLVIAPRGSYRDWAIDKGPTLPSELRKHLSEDLFKRAVSATWISDGTVRNKNNIERILRTTGRPRILIVNIEALSAATKARDAVLEFLSRRRATVAIDESTSVKSPDSKRTKFILELRKLAPIRRIMTGLVVPNSPLDLYSQYYFLDPQILGHWSYYTFRSRYAVMVEQGTGNWFKNRKGEWEERTVDIVMAYQNTEELQEIISPYSFRCLLKDCYDVPPKLYLTRQVELTDEQRKVYNQLVEDAEAELASGAYMSAPQKIVRILRLHEVICGYAKDEQGNIHDLKENKTQALLDVLSEYDGKAIIWCTYDRNIRKVAEVLRKEYGEKSVACYWGGNSDTRHEDELRFLTDPSCRWMVSTPAAGGRGKTWTIADLVVYYSNSYNLEHRDQSEERTQGVGKDRRVTYVDILVPESVDEKIVKALRDKIDIATAIMGDGYREWLI